MLESLGVGITYITLTVSGFLFEIEHKEILENIKVGQTIEVQNQYKERVVYTKKCKECNVDATTYFRVR